MTDKECCLPPVEEKNRKNGFFWGIIYGLLPHTFCILFVLLSIIGATGSSLFLQKIFLVPHLYAVLIIISFLFAILTAIIYLNRQRKLNYKGIKSAWQYLLILFATTVIVNLTIFYFVMPKAANLGSKNNNATSATTIDGGIQTISMNQTNLGYSANKFTIKQGVPVKWVINSNNVQTCASTIVVPELKIRKTLSLGQNVIEFTPTETGEIKFSCIMGMYTGKFIVVK